MAGIWDYRCEQLNTIMREAKSSVVKARGALSRCQATMDEMVTYLGYLSGPGLQERIIELYMRRDPIGGVRYADLTRDDLAEFFIAMAGPVRMALANPETIDVREQLLRMSGFLLHVLTEVYPDEP